jgi:hypothetical protein
LVPGPHGGLLEELGEPEKEMTRKAKGSQGNCGAKSEFFVVNVLYDTYCDRGFTERF